MEGTIAEIRGFAGNFAPRTWAFCEGQLLAISTNTALFSIIGTIYGGDGRTTFALPDLRGRIPLSAGTGPGLHPRNLGARTGLERNILTVSNLASHNHASTGTVHASSTEGTTSDPTGAGMANATYVIDRNNKAPINSYNNSPNSTMLQNGVHVTVGQTGNNQAINDMMPYLTLHWVICLQGIYPSRN